MLAPGAVAEATALMAGEQADARSAGDALDNEVLHAVGLLHWLRYLALPEGEDRDDFDAAAALRCACTGLR